MYTTGYTMSQPLDAGWGFPAESRKAHFFPANEMFSLCRKWGFFAGRRDDSNHESPDNCAQCMRKRLAQLERSTAGA